jgi:hypothetical protein
VVFAVRLAFAIMSSPVLVQKQDFIFTDPDRIKNGASMKGRAKVAFCCMLSNFAGRGQIY